MAKPKAALQQLREKIAARRLQREAGKADKYAKMRLVAQKAPEKFEKHLLRLADKYASMAEGLENLRGNLGLVRAAKEAPMKVRVATAKAYGNNFIRIAHEAPEKLESALVEAYQGLNDIASDIEFAAEQMGVELEQQGADVPGVEEAIVGEAEAPENLMDEAEEPGEEEPAEEEKEAAGGDAWSSDRDESGNPKAVENVDVPRVAAGADSWVTDRDKDADPGKSKELEVPEAQGKAAAKKVTPAGKSATGSL